jgi:polyribonucleotide 5'-hydroxyl-kinase
MLVGPTDSGKSTICKILANYAVRCGSSPLFVDLDVGQGSLTVPGCVSACAVEHPVDVEEAVFPGEPPVVFYVGSASPSENADLYRHCVERLASVVEERERRDAAAGASGILVNTMGWVEGLGYDLLLHAAKVLKVNTVVVVGQDRLHSQLKRSLGGGSGGSGGSGGRVAVVKAAKSDGVVLRSKEQRQDARQRRVEEYFYGLRKDLMPVSQTAKIESLEVYRVGGGPKAPRSALPIGATSVSDPLKISKVSDFRDILNCMVGVSHASSPEELLNANMAGFIYIQDVDVEKGTVTYLSPRDGALPSTLMLAGTYRTYFD